MKKWSTLPGIKRLDHLFLRSKFYLLQRHRHNHLVLERIVGRPLLILPEVMNPKLFRTGELLVRTLNSQLIPRGSKVLDMGTGSGIGAVFAAEWAARVIAVDVNPAAVRCAKINALLNDLEHKIEVLHGHLFEPLIDDKFDVVLFNPPYYKGQPKNNFESAIWGEGVIESFALKLPKHLQPKGKALVVLSNCADLAKIKGEFQENGLALKTIAEQHYLNETLFIWSLSHRVPVPNENVPI
ncbi:MAG: HemK2/MTQ2 family protein methyltransferase [bacterium]